MIAIFKREFRAFFQTVTGWLFLAVNLCLFGLYFFVYNLSYGYPYISQTLSAFNFILLLTIPVLTMRILSEDQKSKTDQLILTAPVSVGKIVFGKFLAMTAVYTIALGIMGFFPIFLKFFGTVSLKESYLALLGIWLYGLTCIAIGTFISSITESQVIAAVLSFLVLFAGYMMEGITSMISSGGNLFTKILGSFSLAKGMNSYFDGTLNVTAMIYYLSMIGLFLLLTVQAIEKRRWSISTRRIGTGIFSTGTIALGIAVVVVINLAAGQIPTKFNSIDMTSQKLFSITEDTEKILSALKDDITIYVLSSEKSQDENLGKMLKRYEDYSSHITVVYKDPAVAPTFFQKYTDAAVTQNSLIVEGSKRSKVIDYNDVYQYDVDYTTYQSTLTGFDGEGQITSAIEYVTSEDSPIFYALEGHDEGTITGTFSQALEKQNAVLESINLLQYETIPGDGVCLIINAPKTDFSQDDVDKVLAYLKDGGKAFIVTCYTDEKLTNFNKILETYQINTVDGMVVEGNSQNYYQNPLYLLPEISSSTVTTDVSDGYIFVPYGQGFTYPEESGDSGITYTPLLRSSDQSYSKVNIATAETSEKEAGDVDGPFTLGLSIAKDDTEIYLFSSEYLLTDTADQNSYGYNGKLFTAITSQFSGGEVASVIPVKDYELPQLSISQGHIILGGLISVILLPLGLLSTGIVIWMRRRKR